MFLKNLGYYATSKDLLAIIRRIDTDGDAKISYSEFADALRSPCPASRPVSAPTSKDFRSRSANKYGVRKEFSSPMKQTAPARTHSATRQKKAPAADNYSTPKKELRAEHHGSAMKTTASYNDSPPPYVSPVKLEEDRELVYTLKAKAGLEESLENAKVRLAQCPDFNLYDAFKIFDNAHQGYVSLIDFKYGLQDIGVYAPIE